MLRRFVSILLASLMAVIAMRASEVSVAPSILVQNYTVEDYEASCQNWNIAVSYHGLLYIANNSGLLTFDGNTWRLYPLPDKSPIYDVTFHNDTIYTQGSNSVGYWLHSETEELVYTPLDRLPAGVRFDSLAVPPIILPAELRDKQISAFADTGDLCFIGTTTAGVYITNRQGEIFYHLSINNRLPDNIVRGFCVQDKNLVWVALDNGISQIDINPPVSMLGRRNRIGKLEDAARVDNQLYIQTNLGYFHCDLNARDELTPIPEAEGREHISPRPPYERIPVGDIFERPDQLGTFAKAEDVYPASEDLYWLTYDNEAVLLHREEEAHSVKCRILFDNYNLNLVTYGRQIIPLDDSLDLVSSMQGTLLINTRHLIAGSLGTLTTPRFTHLSYTDRKGTHILRPDTQEVSLPHSFQEVSLFVGTTVFTPNHQISYKLDGVSTDWSPWQKDGEITFLKLPEGSYELHIRKYVTRGPFPEITMRIVVRPPWYNTVWAYLIYIALVGGGVWAGARIHVHQLRKKELQKLKEERQIEQQRLQQLRSEMLETELQNKNNELMLQTTALVKRNEAVQAIMEELDKQKEALGDRYPNKLYNRLRSLMESTLNNQADWVQFETYFNSAYHNFMDRLRQQYTDITAGDLRICCLLRMNLSTKEIASLMNVSVRAIELRRYRLRKRLSLDGDTNLVDFLMNF